MGQIYFNKEEDLIRLLNKKNENYYFKIFIK
jgi:hypothetical protein